MAASLQWLTGGRHIFGIGAGWLEEEYEAYNWPFPRPAARIRQLEETIEIVKLLWTKSPASYEGRYYRIDNAYCHPQPNPLPPVMVGGGGEQLTPAGGGKARRLVEFAGRDPGDLCAQGGCVA